MILYTLRKLHHGHPLPEDLTITAFRCWGENCRDPDGGIRKNAKFHLHREYKDGKWGREIPRKPHDPGREYISLASYFYLYEVGADAIAESEHRKDLIPPYAWDRYHEQQRQFHWLRRQRVFTKSLIAEDVKAIRKILPGIDVYCATTVNLYFPLEIEWVLHLAGVLPDLHDEEAVLPFTNIITPIGDFATLRQQVESSLAVLRRATAFLQENAEGLVTMFPKLQEILVP